MPMNRPLILLCTATFLGSHAGRLMAQPYLGAALARTSTEYKDVKDGNGFSLAAGYQLSDLPIFLEGEYYSSGKMKVERADGPTLSYRGALAHIGYAFRLNEYGRIWLKGGGYALGSKLRLNDDYANEHTKGFSLGAGADWMFAPQFGLRAEIETPFKAKSLPGFRSNESTQLSIIKIGFVWRPRSVARGLPAPAASATAAVATPPIPSATEAPLPPVVAAEPARTVPAAKPAAVRVVVPLTAGMTATVRAGTKLLVRPKVDAPVDSTFVTEATVVLNGSTYGSAGIWWYVRDIDHAGWVQASELEPQAE